MLEISQIKELINPVSTLHYSIESLIQDLSGSLQEGLSGLAGLSDSRAMILQQTHRAHV